MSVLAAFPETLGAGFAGGTPWRRKSAYEHRRAVFRYWPPLPPEGQTF
jgi:hypothetical protein